MADIRVAQKALIIRILEGNGKTPLLERKCAFDNMGLAEPLSKLVDKVAKHAYQVTDEDIDAVKASGLREDQILEILVCAAVGQATRQYDAGIAAVTAVTASIPSGFHRLPERSGQQSRFHTFAANRFDSHQGRVVPLAVTLLDADPQSRLPDGLWPSDHAAVVAGVIVKEK
jgi:hypothetical protein